MKFPSRVCYKSALFRWLLLADDQFASFKQAKIDGYFANFEQGEIDNQFPVIYRIIVVLIIIITIITTKK